MEVVSLGQNFNKPIVLCLGFFDCMHVGHVALLQRAKLLAKNCSVALFTFNNNHFETLKRPSKLLYTFDERLDIYQNLGVDVVIHARFDKEFMSKSGEQFLSELCRYNLQAVVCGDDFTCGSDLMDAATVRKTLKDVCPVEVVDLVTCNGQKIGSTLVRHLLDQNDVADANDYLSQPFHFVGIVQHGRSVGHTLGFPTINIAVPNEKLAPQGVYVGQVAVDGACYKAVINVGNVPTFGIDKPSVEAHLINFDGNLYGKMVKISLISFLRPIQKFADAEELKKQLTKDVEVASHDKIRP